jgi:hypothetical protein
MTVREVAEALDLEILTEGINMEGIVETGYTSDLLSDVIAHAPERSAWITVQRHINILGVAKLKEVAAIIIPGGLKVEEEVIERARSEGIALMRGKETVFVLSGLLYNLLRNE